MSHPLMRPTPYETKAVCKQGDHCTYIEQPLLICRMTGVGGRPEVIIEGSNSIDRGWQEYEFQYKPGNVSYKLPVVGRQRFFFNMHALMAK